MAKTGRSKHIALEYKQLRRLAQAVGELENARTTTDLKDLAFSALDSFGPGSLICFEKFALSSADYEVSYNGNDPSSEDMAIFSQLYQQHPYINYLAQGGAELAVRPTDLVCPVLC